jgi:hypothetical protein
MVVVGLMLFVGCGRLMFDPGVDSGPRPDSDPGVDSDPGSGIDHHLHTIEGWSIPISTTTPGM